MTMNSILKLAGLMFLAFTLGLPAQAQTAQSEANSAAQSASGSQSASLAQGGSVTFNTPSEQRVTQSGTTRIENAPSLGGLALGGGHPCAYSPASGQLSVIGGGAGFGGMTIDSACLLLVNAAASGDRRAYNAAMNMIAARDPEACKAMYLAGMIGDCVDRQGKSSVRSAPKTKAAAPVASVGYSKCSKNGGTVYIKYTANANKAAAQAACLASLGY